MGQTVISEEGGMNVVPFPAAAPNADELVAEPDVLRLRKCLACGTLREARKNGKITWTRGKRGTAWYRLADVDRFIQAELERKCPGPVVPHSSNSADIGSDANPENKTSMT